AADALFDDRLAADAEAHRRAAGAAARREENGRADHRRIVPGHPVALPRRTGTTGGTGTPENEGPQGRLRGCPLGPYQHARVHSEPLTAPPTPPPGPLPEAERRSREVLLPLFVSGRE